MPHEIFPILEFDELIELFEYKNRRAALRAIREGRFPVRVFILAGRRVAHVDSIDKYFEEQRALVAAESNTHSRGRP